MCADVQAAQDAPILDVGTGNGTMLVGLAAQVLDLLCNYKFAKTTKPPRLLVV